MRTEAQIKASQNNGAKSKGPVTQEGKAKSRMNAVKHGIFLSEEFLLRSESLEAYESLRSALFLEFNPQTPYECILIENVVNCIWKLRRIDLATRHLLEWDLKVNLGAGFCAQRRGFEFLDRSQRHLLKIRDNDLKLFQTLKKEREEKEENEPKTELPELENVTILTPEGAIKSILSEIPKLTPPQLLEAINHHPYFKIAPSPTNPKDFEWEYTIPQAEYETNPAYLKAI